MNSQGDVFLKEVQIPQAGETKEVRSAEAGTMKRHRRQLEDKLKTIRKHILIMIEIAFECQHRPTETEWTQVFRHPSDIYNVIHKSPSLLAKGHTLKHAC